MKSIKKSSIIQEDEQKMFTEVQILKQCDHPNILKLYELYQDDTNYYLITEYVPAHLSHEMKLQALLLSPQF